MIQTGLTLVTGATGSGKTSLVVGWLSAERERPVYALGIPDLQTPHLPAPPVAEWTEVRESPEDSTLKLPYFRFQPGAVLVCDEAQRVYPPRSIGSKVPDHVAALSTRRHTGLDVILITQHPGLLDAAVRKLVTLHYHVHSTQYGRFLLRWDGAAGDPSSSASRALAERTRYKPDPSTFVLYKSAEMHTKGPRHVPRAAVVGGAVLVLTLVAGWIAYGRVQGKMEQPVLPDVAVHDVTRASASSVEVSTREIGYLQARQPEIAGLVHTAPVYQELARPVAVPYPMGCVRSSTRCVCYDQRGGLYRVGESICRQWVEHAPFLDFRPDPVQSGPGATATVAAAPASAPPSRDAAPAATRAGRVLDVAPALPAVSTAPG